MPPVMDTGHNCTLRVVVGGRGGGGIVSEIRFRFGDVWLCTGQSNMGMVMHKTNHFQKVRATDLKGNKRNNNNSDNPLTSRRTYGSKKMLSVFKVFAF